MMKIVTLLLLSYSIGAIFEHQQGHQDWVKRQYGELNQVSMGNSIFFNSKSLIGQMSKNEGTVQYSHQHQGKFIKCAQETDGLQYVFYDEGQQRINLYKQKENIFKPLVSTKLQGVIQHCLILKTEQFVIVTSKYMIVVDRDAITQTHPLGEDKEVLAAGYVHKDAVQYSTLLMKDNKKVCLYQVEAAALLSQKECQQIGIGKMNVQLMPDSYLYWDDTVALHIQIDKIQSLYGHNELLSKSRTFFPASKAFISRIDSKLFMYQINVQGDPKLIHEFPVAVAFVQSPEGRIKMNHFYYVRYDKKKIYFQQYDSESDQDTNLGIVDAGSESRPLKVFMRNLDDNKKVFLVQHEDLHTFAYLQGILWSSEQSLSNIAAVVWEPYSDERSHVGSYFESLDKNGVQNPLYLVQNIILRFANDIQDLIQYSQSVPEKMRIFMENMQSLILKGKTNTREGSQEYDITYGLRQKIVIVTHLKTVLCYNSDDGQLLWKDSGMLGRMDDSFELKGHFKIELKIVVREVQDNALHLSHLLVYHSVEKQRLNLFLLDPLSGELQQVASQKSSSPVHLQSYLVQHDKSQHDNIVVIINQDNEIITYPKAPLETIGLGRGAPVVFYNYDESMNEIRGFQFIKDQIVQTWNYRIGGQEQVIKIRSSFAKGQENPRIAVWDDRRVLFKLIDHSNFALLTQNLESNILSLAIINAKTGKVIFQGVQKNVDFKQPINLVFDENSVFVTFFNPLQSMFEIWTIETFHHNIEVSFLKILEDYYFNQKEETHLNYYDTQLQAVFIQQIFGFTLGIKSLSIARTLKSLTKKNLLIITPENQVHSLDRNFVSSRRRLNAGATQVRDDSFESLELPPYAYLLPTNYMTILNYHQEVQDLDQFHIQPTNLESTSLLLVTGQDVFFTRISPDRTYDMIQPDFNYSLLLLTVAFIIGLSYFMRSMAKKSKVLKVFYSS